MLQQTKEIPSSKQQNPSPYWQSLKIWINNISFQIEEIKLLHFINHTQYRQEGPSPQFFHIAGQRITTFQEFQEHQERLIWCTYRRNVRITDSIHSDVGWGCLLRVAQMAIANSLLSYSQRMAAINRAKIIKACAQEKEAHYSIINLVEIGREEWGKKAGEWYGMSQVASILETLQTRNPMPGSQNLTVRVYNQIVSIDELMPILQSEDREGKNLSQEYILKEEIHTTDQNTQKCNKKSVLLMITTQFDPYNRAQEKQHLLNLMELTSFSSCLGGVPQKARFITGKYQDQLFYLDPHLVQESVSLQSLEQSMDTFSCKKVRSMQCSDLEPSLTLCFNLNNQQDLLQLITALDELEDSNPEQQFISYTWTHKPLDLNLTRTQSIDLDFQLLQPSDQRSQQIQRLTFQQLTV